MKTEGKARPLVPNDAVWTRHYTGRYEWWTYGDYMARQDRINGPWILRYRGECIGKTEFLQDAQRMAETMDIHNCEETK